MHSLRIVSVFLLLVFISIGAAGGCGGDDEESNLSLLDGGELAGELNCVDGIDNDGDTEIDCADIDCSFDPVCVDDQTMADDDDDITPPDPPGDELVLIEPVNNQAIIQNNPDIGCAFSGVGGFGLEIFFDWNDLESPNGISGYEIFVIGPPPAIFPIVDTFVTESEFTETSCNTFIIDPNLEGWTWSVTAIDNEGNEVDESDTETFQFEPCRFNDGTGCGGQPPTEPTTGPNPDITVPILLEPINNQIIQQNNPDIGCQFIENFGYGFEVFYDWTDSESPNGISGYEITVMRENSMFTSTTFVTGSEFRDTSCNAFIIDANLGNRIWNVTAIDNLGNRSAVSETGVFNYGECRLEGGIPCNAPPF